MEKKGEQNFFTSQMIKDCMKKVVAVNLHQAVKVGLLPTLRQRERGVWSLQVDSDLEIKAYYAGHVLGAAMFQVKVRHQSIVYTV